MSDTENVAVVEISALAAMTGAEIDQQVATAKRWPRDLRTFQKNALAMATVDEDTAVSMFYAVPRDGKMIEGPSARLAEIIMLTWGNLRGGSRVVDIGDRFLRAQGSVHDLESNTAVLVEVTRRISNRQGKRYSDDMIGTTAQAAMSIALRNAVLKIVPAAMVRPIYEAARAMAMKEGGALEQQWQKVLVAFSKLGGTQADLYAILKRDPKTPPTAEDILTLRGIFTAIQQGETTLASVLSDVQPESGGVHAVPDGGDKVAAKLGAIGEKLAPSIDHAPHIADARQQVMELESVLFTSPDEAELSRKTGLGQVTLDDLPLDTLNAYAVALKNRVEAKAKPKAKA